MNKKKNEFSFAVPLHIYIFANVKHVKRRYMSTATLTNLRDYLYGTMSAEDMIWLVEELTGYIRKGEELKPYTMEELDARIDKSERDAAEGRFRTHEEVFANIMNADFQKAV